jgi:hypothetical protein
MPRKTNSRYYEWEVSVPVSKKLEAGNLSDVTAAVAAGTQMHFDA